MNELVVQVDLVVAGISAFGWRKRRIREELLAHLAMIHEEELGRASSAEVALARSLERWGNAREIAIELQRAVPSYERLANTPLARLAPVDGLLWRKSEDESTTRYATRFATYITMMASILGGIPALACSLFLGGPPAHPSDSVVNVVSCSAAGIVALGASSFLTAAIFDRSGLRARIAPQSPLSVVAKGAVITGLVALLSLVFLGVFLGLTLSIPGDHGERSKSLHALLQNAPLWVLSIAPLLVFVATTLGLAYEKRAADTFAID